MSMSDPIADMLTRIRNAQMVEKTTVSMPASKVKSAIAQVLKDEGYIDNFQVKTNEGKSELEISLKYYAGRPVIERIERVSRPGLRVYRGRNAIPPGLAVGRTCRRRHPWPLSHPPFRCAEWGDAMCAWKADQRWAKSRRRSCTSRLTVPSG